MNSAAVCCGGLSARRWGGWLPAAHYPLGLHWRRGCGPGDRCPQGGVLVLVVVVTGSSPAWLLPFTSAGQRSSHRVGTSSHWGGTALAVTR